MNEEEYFRKSKKDGLPNRCPILNNCMRRAITIYFFSDYYKYDRQKNVIKKLQEEGVLSDDFENNKIGLQGEAPIWSKGKDLTYYNNTCPEVNLFDSENSLFCACNTASSGGEYDKLRKGNEFINEKFKHYSECAEYSKYVFDKSYQQKAHRVKTSNNRTGISKKLRFEVFERDNYTCQYCGQNLKEDKIKLQLDHKTPVSAGGTDDYNNLITSCADCNLGKSNKIIK